MIRPRLRSFVAVPLLVSSVLFSTALWWASREFDGLMQKLVGYLPAWLSWLTWLLWPLFAIVILIVIFYTFSLVANLIASPFNGLLAERVEDLARPGRARTATGPLWKEIALAPVAELKKLLYFVVWAVPLLVLFIIPTVNAAAPFIWMAFSAWMLALQYADYPMGNHGIRFKEQRRLLADQRLLVFGFGCGVLLVTLIPVINFLAMPAAVIGATLLWVEEFGDRYPERTDIDTVTSNPSPTDADTSRGCH
jgi:CysZ protein